MEQRSAERSGAGGAAHSSGALLAVMAMVATIPAETLVVFPGLGTLTRLLGGIAMILTAADCLRLYRLRALAPPHLAMYAYVTWTAVTLLWSVSPAESMTRIMSYGQMVLLVWVLHELAETPRYRRAIIASYVAGAVAGSSLVMRAFLQGTQLFEYDNRYGTMGSDPNDLALSLVIAVPLATHLAVSTKARVVQVLAIPSTGLLIAATVLTGSRGALLALLVSVLVMGGLYGKGKRQRMVATAVLATIALGAYLAVDRLPDNVLRRYVNIPAELSEGKMAERRALWQVASDLFLARPLSGWGSGAFPEAAWKHSGMQSVAHNTFLSVATEQGLPGLILFTFIVVRLAQTARTGGSSAVRMLLPSMAAWGVGVCGLTWECAKATWFLFGILGSYGPAQVSEEHRAELSNLYRQGRVYASTSDRITTGRRRRRAGRAFAD